MNNNFVKIEESEIIKRLQTVVRNTVIEHPIQIEDYQNSKSPIPAAVLLPMFCNRDGWNLIFTRRNSDLPDHSGQVSFPGGRSDFEDRNAIQTALREASEEIGLHPNDVTILGILPDLLTITNYLVTPVVGVLEMPYQFKIAENEVSRIFSIPLNWLSNSENYKISQRKLPDSEESISVVYFEEYDGEFLWGVTARIVLSFILLLK